VEGKRAERRASDECPGQHVNPGEHHAAAEAEEGKAALMSMPAFPPAVNVPLVGQPFKILTHYPTVIVRCTCAEDAPILVLIGKGNVGTCAKCHQSYGIADVGPISVGIARMDKQ